MLTDQELIDGLRGGLAPLRSPSRPDRPDPTAGRGASHAQEPRCAWPSSAGDGVSCRSLPMEIERPACGALRRHLDADQARLTVGHGNLPAGGQGDPDVE